MPKFTANELRAAFEPGSSSDWVASFSDSGSRAPDANIFNFIKTSDLNYSPVKDVDYNQIVIKNKEFNIGPGLEFKVPVFAQRGLELKVTFYDNHFKEIRYALLDWVNEFLEITQGRAPTLSNIKDYCLLIDIYHFDRQSNGLDKDDSLYILPDSSVAFLGNQDFQADTLPIQFNIVGTR